MSELGGGRCGRCAAYIHGEAVEVNGWWLHKECVPAQESSDLDCPACGYDQMAPHNGRGSCPPRSTERQENR